MKTLLSKLSVESRVKNEPVCDIKCDILKFSKECMKYLKSWYIQKHIGSALFFFFKYIYIFINILTAPGISPRNEQTINLFLVFCHFFFVNFARYMTSFYLSKTGRFRWECMFRLLVIRDSNKPGLTTTAAGAPRGCWSGCMVRTFKTYRPQLCRVYLASPTAYALLAGGGVLICYIL